ncbi:DEAD/DEAH box helicase [Aerosticca soli]|uniref:ATP-dependent RNA helicase DeaD n=1 Tax=Aerosticca soli TaxID=2010829 RepID=A0A2Z6E4U8_9GAMM|nr:DEAD/DEAH box helicase [Aerosticca soli]MDI3262483.1 DEAD/DEAH box helicase [Fulvimonas sp.]BBD80053.1 DEAD-box ATP-dependent RNA helicase CshA [Aerosticca soli]
MTSPASDSSLASAGFAAFGLKPALLQALAEVGYESPSPIQAATLPPLLAGRDVLGQAQTGTGKTAAFALPILSRIDLDTRKPQALVLAPTRELAIQVAEAFQRYAAHLSGLQVLPIYGGQSYGPQLNALRRGVQVVVGTPGRVIDHLERGTLDLAELKFVVLDEADEMLRMGFVDDVEKVLEATPPNRQVALFSATMPAPIRKIAQRHLKDPVEVAIKAATATATNIRQRYWWVSGVHKLDAMTRILEAEPFDAMIVFARTKQATEELAEKLAARGFAAAAINGDMAQPQRERVIQQLREGKLDILVATDVAARGLDVERVSHVLNYDIPYDTESYVHRIGRTGRAGRSGEAILFVTPREKGMLRAIERATRQPIEEMKLPTVEAVNDQRIARFKQRISDTLAAGGLELFQRLVEEYEQEHDVPALEIAAALARIAQGRQPLLLDPPPRREPRDTAAHGEETEAHGRRDRPSREPSRREAARPARPHVTEAGKRTYRIEVGHRHGVKPGNIIGAIANEAGLESQHIGRLSIREDYSLIDLPEGMPKEIFEHLRKVWVSQQQLRISAWDGEDESGGTRPPRKAGPARQGEGRSRKPGRKPPSRR